MMDTQQNNAGRVVLKTQRQLDFPPVRLPKALDRRRPRHSFGPRRWKTENHSGHALSLGARPLDE